MMKKMNKVVNQGDFFILSPSKGYSGKQIRDAMQVMELWNGCMTVKCQSGCMDKPYEHFEKVTDLSKMDNIYHAPYFEDNRK
jgi:hypothetical protein